MKPQKHFRARIPVRGTAGRRPGGAPRPADATRTRTNVSQVADVSRPRWRHAENVAAALLGTRRPKPTGGHRPRGIRARC